MNCRSKTCLRIYFPKASALTCDRIDTPYALGRPFFADQRKRLGFGGVDQVGAAAKLDGIRVKLWVLGVWCNSRAHISKAHATLTIFSPLLSRLRQDEEEEQTEKEEREKRKTAPSHRLIDRPLMRRWTPHARGRDRPLQTLHELR